uniref:Uncharacterized protein n=1 Tax=Brassica oleracea var. oleracea TaxID=109376 RepID=A0A0D3CGN4_BRAOL
MIEALRMAARNICYALTTFSELDRDTEADLIEREKLLEVFLGRTEAVAELEEVLEELGTVKDKNESLEQEVRKVRKVQQKGLPRFVHGRTSESGAKGACQEVRRDVRQGVRHEVLQRLALVQGMRLIGASATVSGQARSNIGCAVGSVGSQVLNRSGSRGSLRGASDRDTVLVIPLQQGLCHYYT